MGQYTLQNNQYPKTISKTTDVLTNHQWDDKYKLADNKKKEHNVHKSSYDDDDDTQDGKSLAQTTEKDKSEITCFCCGEKGHYSGGCDKTIPKDDWYI